MRHHDLDEVPMHGEYRSAVVPLSKVLLTLIMVFLSGGCRDKDVDGKGKVVRARQSESFLEVITEPAQIKAAKELAAKNNSAPLSAETLADVWMLSPDLIPADKPRDEAMSQLHQVIGDTKLAARTRCTAACVLTLIDSDDGQKAILGLLQRATGEEKQALLSALSLLDDTETEITEAALIAELISYVQAPDLAVSAVRICAQLKLPKLQDVLWQQLPASRDAQTAEILFWLARTWPSKRVLTECVGALSQLEDPDRERCLMAMTYLFEVKEDDVGEDATEAVASELLDRIAAGKTGMFDFPQSVCADVLKSGRGLKAVSLAQAVQRHTRDRYLHSCAYVFQRRREGVAAREEILSDLQQTETFNLALDAVTEIYSNTEDSTLVAALAKQLSVRQGPKELVELAQALIALGGDLAMTQVRAACARLPEEQRNALLATIDREPPIEVIRGLVSAGIIVVDSPEKFLDQVAKQRVAEYGENTGEHVGVMEILHSAGIAVSFDAETGTLPVRHDELLQDLANGSGGVFAPEGCYEGMLQKDEEDWDSPYQVQFVHGHRLYRFTARNLGDWYDVERVVLACNRALSDSQVPQRFFQAGGGGQVATFICVTAGQANVLSRQFHITWEEDLSAAMEEGKAYEEHVIRQMREEEGL